VFVNILRDIFKEETVEYVLALIDEMLTGAQIDFWHCWLSVDHEFLTYLLPSCAANPKRARLFHDESLSNEDTYEPFLS